MTKLINTVYEIGEWPKHFIEATMIVLKKEPQDTKCNDHHTISLIAHTAKIVTNILRKRLKRKLRKYLEKISLDLEEEKEPEMQWDAENNIRTNLEDR